MERVNGQFVLSPHSHACYEAMDVVAGLMTTREIARKEKNWDKMCDRIRDEMYDGMMEKIEKLAAKTEGTEFHGEILEMKRYMSKYYKKEVKTDKIRDFINVLGFKHILMAKRNSRHLCGELEAMHHGLFRGHGEKKIKKQNVLENIPL